MSGQKAPNDPRAYVHAVIDAYVRLPETPVRARREDRRLAAELRQQGVALETVEAAILLATARRARRCTKAPPLQAIRSLHYFLPVIAEVLNAPLQADYVDYLRTVVAEWLEELAHTPEGLRGRGSALVQKTTFLHER
ncbi:MAG: hypothetical protein ACRD1B_07940 [Thermoanaerobaculia bacterium]